MTKLIRISERDTASLEKIRALDTASKSYTQPQSYREIVVVKPWGYEFLLYENESVAIWYLHIEKGHSTSMHCHPTKKTALIVLSGQALCNTFYNRNYLSGIDSVVIENGVFHSTQSLSTGGVDLIEIETPPNKTDLVRLNDQYGRQGAGYEGLSEMKRDHLERYGYFFLATPDPGARTTHQTDHFEISLAGFENGAEFGAALSQRKGEFYCSCRGRILDGQGTVVLDVGDSAEGTFLGAFEGLRADGPVLLLKSRLRAVLQDA